MTTSPGGAAPDGRTASVVCFLAELTAWIATPWALAPHSIPLAVAAVAVTVLCVAVVVLEQPRWRWLLGASAQPETR